MLLPKQTLGLFLCLGLGVTFVTSRVTACEASPVTHGKCLLLRGRIFRSNGTPSMRIAPINSHRILGVLPAEHEDVPEDIRKGVTFDQDAIADMEVCPLSPASQGEMQLVCVRSVSNITFKNH
jgi:hypothetical protein